MTSSSSFSWGEDITPEMNKEFEKLMEGYHDLVESGRREVLKIEGLP